MPSQIAKVVWTNSDRDIKLKLKLKLGETQAKVFQDYQTMAILLSQAFGSGKKSEAAPRTKDEALAQFASVFGRGSP